MQMSIRHVTPEARAASSHLGPTLAEQHHQPQVARSRGEAEGAHAVFRHHVDTGPELQEERGDLQVAQVALDTEHWGVVEDFCAIVDVGPGQHQQTAHLRTQTKGTVWSIGTTHQCLLMGCFGPKSNSFPSPVLVL